jgi:hypothetical protein
MEKGVYTRSESIPYTRIYVLFPFLLQVSSGSSKFVPFNGSIQRWHLRRI